jgi:transposase
MVRERAAEKLDDWLMQAETGELKEFQRFAVSLRSDYQAVKAGLSLDWSNAQTGGQVNPPEVLKTADVWASQL